MTKLLVVKLVPCGSKITGPVKWKVKLVAEACGKLVTKYPFSNP